MTDVPEITQREVDDFREQWESMQKRCSIQDNGFVFVGSDGKRKRAGWSPLRRKIERARTEILMLWYRFKYR